MTVSSPVEERRRAGPHVLVPVWSAWAALVLALALAGPEAPGATLLLGLHATATSLLLLTLRGPVGILLLLAFWLRCALVLLDLSGDRDLFGSGHDAEAFLSAATAISAAPGLLATDIYGGVYTKITGALFLLTGPTQALVQYTNVLLYLSGVVLVARAVRVLEVDRRIIPWAVAICGLLPVPAFLSALFLRESLIFFLVAASVHGFCRWLVRGGSGNVLVAVGALFAAGTLHVGVLGVIVGYALAGVAYDPQGRQLRPRLRGSGPWVALLAVMTVLALRFPELVLGKVATIDSASDLYARTSASAGESAYLTGVSIETPVDLLTWGGVKAGLLLLAPSPLHWRGLGDVAAFALDAAVHAAVPVYLVLRLRRTAPGVRRQQVVVLLVAFLSAVVVFGAGTANAGTAMRHRQKLLPLAVVACALAAPPMRQPTSGAAAPRQRRAGTPGPAPADRPEPTGPGMP